jgi:transposase-like protein
LPEKLTSGDYAAENRRLKKALAQAELERYILKKAAAYFAKETL